MQLDHYLSDVVSDETLPDDIRQHAAHMLQQWRQGIVPSAKDMRTLDGMLTRMKRVPCERLERDNGCGWIRNEGAANGLYVPPVGERATCQYLGRQQQCPGFRAVRST